ncbi:TadE/TadG family type IV pilus assembly protein [Mesorhizobium sp. CA5]|uniref:TadE/TadG family type IV pilus assembly protein n=1 Tax=Mesorhizobium sp. CA5 TaxID=2876638 RepID=UPI001CD0878D|nr:TadE/TadG family type IV pilus assembly protein [Mesorhizobium sp. CA5]MBZ9845732.1 pilus assembly protein [Mesorhizobium sp. CA5]
MIAALSQIIRRFQGDQGGAALVEVALVAPFMLLLSAGVFEFSNILNTRLLLLAGVEDAARYMARCNDSNWNNCITVGTNLAVNGAVTGGSARVLGWTTAQITVTTTSTPAIDPATGTELYLSNTSNVNVVEVSTSYPYSNLGLWGYLGFGALTLTVSHQERVFGW